MLVRRLAPARTAGQWPFSDLDRVRQDMLRFYETFARDLLPEASAGVFPPINVTQDQDSFHIRAQLPGIKVEDLSITSDRNRISITGKRTIPEEGARVSYHRREREEGTFSRSFTLPAAFDPAKVEARYRDGILTITLPKSEEGKPRQIPVRAS